MEPADIDWKKVESVSVRDETYEHIDAPKWLDLSVADDPPPFDGDAWFCRPECRHPKTLEDFQKLSPSPKLKPKLPLGERKFNNSQTLKRRGAIAALPPISPAAKSKGSHGSSGGKKFRDDLENQDPNFEGCVVVAVADSKVVAKEGKMKIKSSSEKREVGAEEEEKVEPARSKKGLPRLRSTMSARNLFSGRDILGQISEFCHEIKKLAVGRDRRSASVARDMAKEENEERKVLLDSSIKTNGESIKKSKKLTVKVESDDEKNIMKVEDKAFKEVRACPPTPQKFPSPSSRRLPNTKAATSTISLLNNNKPHKSLAPERGTLQQLDLGKEEKRALAAKDNDCNIAAAADGHDGSALDMFWFFKPCTYLAK